MRKKPYSPPRLSRVTVLTPAMRAMLEEVRAIYKSESRARPGQVGPGQRGTNGHPLAASRPVGS